MRLCIQRVKRADVTVQGRQTGAIGPGLLVLTGVGRDDTEESVRAMAGRLLKLRIFEDPDGKMNLSVRDMGGGVLAVSQFTLYADTSRGNRPGFSFAAPPETAKGLFDCFCDEIKKIHGAVYTGEFGAHMEVELVNDGPVTIWLEG